MAYKTGENFSITITDVITDNCGNSIYKVGNCWFNESEINSFKDPTEHKPENKNPFERTGDPYYYIDYLGRIFGATDEGYEIDDRTYNVANYCTDANMMEQRALHETLNRLLWRYSEEHGGDPKWNGKRLHWYIYRDEIDGIMDVSDHEAYHVFGAPYFNSEAIALEAIHDIVEPFLAEHQEFVW